MNKIFSIVIDENFDASLKTFQSNLSMDEEIVSTCVVKDRFVVCTQKIDKPNYHNRNLLLEEASKILKTSKIIKS